MALSQQELDQISAAVQQNTAHLPSKEDVKAIVGDELADSLSLDSLARVLGDEVEKRNRPLHTDVSRTLASVDTTRPPATVSL